MQAPFSALIGSRRHVPRMAIAALRTPCPPSSRGWQRDKRSACLSHAPRSLPVTDPFQRLDQARKASQSAVSRLLRSAHDVNLFNTQIATDQASKPCGVSQNRRIRTSRTAMPVICPCHEPPAGIQSYYSGCHRYERGTSSLPVTLSG
jgi:hypothetical protein